MRRRKRLRKKVHRRYLTTVVGYLSAMDDSLRQRLLSSEAGEPFAIRVGSKLPIDRLIRRWGLNYWVRASRKLAAGTAVIAFWAAEFPEVWDEAVIFNRADLI
jgi:hypothetical protein